MNHMDTLIKKTKKTMKISKGAKWWCGSKETRAESAAATRRQQKDE